MLQMVIPGARGRGSSPSGIDGCRGPTQRDPSTGQCRRDSGHRAPGPQSGGAKRVNIPSAEFRSVRRIPGHMLEMCTRKA